MLLISSKLFPNRKVTEMMQLEPSKLKYVVNHGMAPCVKEILENQVIDTVWFIVSLDESINEVTQTSEMDICLLFWNKESTKLKTDFGTASFKDMPLINIYWAMLMKVLRSKKWKKWLKC